MNLSKKEELVFKIREFHRFYLPKFDLLNKTYLNSEYSTTEARILFEIVENGVNMAQSLVDKLKIDKSYLSRILKKFEKNNLMTRKISDKDARVFIILPTSKCAKIVKQLVDRANEKTKEVLVNLSNDECDEVLKSLHLIINLLTKERI